MANLLCLVPAVLGLWLFSQSILLPDLLSTFVHLSYLSAENDCCISPGATSQETVTVAVVSHYRDEQCCFQEAVAAPGILMGFF